MTPQPLPPEQIKTPTGIGVNGGEGGTDYHDLYDEEPGSRPRQRTLRRFVQRGSQLVEVESVIRETR